MEKGIKINKSDIMVTKAFGKLNPILKNITMNKTNRKHIENGVNVSLNIGFEKWEKMCGFSQSNIKIVEELQNNFK